MQNLIKKRYFPFSFKSCSPDSKENNPSSFQVPAQYNSRCLSPKTNFIRYDASDSIVDVPEEYEEFLKRKFSKMCMNRSSTKKRENRSSPYLQHNHSTSIGPSKNITLDHSRSIRDKENDPAIFAKPMSKESVLNKRKATLKSLTKTLLSKEFSK